MNSEILEIVEAVKSGKSSARAEVEKAVAAAKANEKLHAFLEVLENEALARADEIDARIAKGEDVGRLAGVPYAVKDNYLTTVGHTTAAAKILENFESPIDATAIERLNNEGAILIGKTNLDAFANGGSTENSAFGPTHNAVDPERVPGGTSGGSAAAVAANIVPFALGSDTGGSIRQPASFNGVVGLRPTYGLTSRYGVIAFASSTDTVGCLTRTVADTELITEIIAGPDGKDGTVHPDFFKVETSKPKNLKIGLIKEFIGDGVDEDVKKRTLEFADKLRATGHVVEEISLSMMKYVIAIYYIVTMAELSSNLARYDGVRYGVRSKETKDLDEVYNLSRSAGFMPENKRRIMIGSFVLSSGYFDAYYLQAQKARTLLIQEFDKLFADYDFLIGPVAPTPAFKLGKNTSDPVQMYLEDIMTVQAPLAGIPAISIPNGVSSDGLPIGIQIIGPQKSDAKLLAFAKSMEEK